MQARDLYGLPLERFIPERNVLVRELRREGQREEAASVSKLRKPSVAAWAVNQLVRTQGRLIQSLFAAGDALQQAHADLMAGGADAGSLRRALDAEREALETIAEKARGLLTEDGHELTAARLEQVSDTLHAAALDSDVRARVQDGCLDRELRHVGIGALAAGTASSGARRSSGKRASTRKLEAAREAEAQAQRRAERAHGKLSVAEARRDTAKKALEDAERALAAAREAAHRAASEHQRARRALKRADPAS